MIILIHFNFKQNIFDIINKIFEPYRNQNKNIPIINQEDDNSVIKYYTDLIMNDNKNTDL